MRHPQDEDPGFSMRYCADQINDALRFCAIVACVTAVICKLIEAAAQQ